MTADLFPLMVSQHWQLVSKADARCRVLADRHYTRQHPGAAMFTRPGYNAVLYARGPGYQAAWAWWRPKWESGILGTERQDGLRAIECTLFRLERCPLPTAHCPLPTASVLIAEAVAALVHPKVHRALHLEQAGPIAFLVTAVGIDQTARRRSRRAPPGQCYLAAGWTPFAHPTATHLAWLTHPMV